MVEHITTPCPDCTRGYVMAIKYSPASAANSIPWRRRVAEICATCGGTAEIDSEDPDECDPCREVTCPDCDVTGCPMCERCNCEEGS